MSIEDTAASLHPLERKVLPLIASHSDFQELIEASKLKDVEVMRALQWLQNKKLIVMHQTLKELVMLDTNGIKYAKQGLPESKFLASIAGKEPLSQIGKKTGLNEKELQISMGILRGKNAITISKEKEIMIAVSHEGHALLKKGLDEDSFLRMQFPFSGSDLNAKEKEILEQLKKRKDIIKTDIIKIIKVELTGIGIATLEHGISDKEVIERITPLHIKEGSWHGKTIRKYDTTINVPPIHGGKVHFVDQSIDYIKRIWLDLGFKEMKGTMVQTAFWDLDALFVPQDHPAREMQDTFYIKDPKKGLLPNDLLKKIKDTHEHGWNTGSKGWQYQWSDETARENLLRTHTTVLSAQTIHSLKKENLPAKFFSVGKVFRNEALSWKHLFEFIQVEGIVVDPDANFMHLKGYLKEFFSKMGFSDVRIRPGHFPYTEPSAEVDVWHPIKKTWVELGGSGIFRPEVVKPLLGETVPVLAWGLGMERSIMEYYGLTDVRDIYKNDIKQLREMKLWMK